MGVIANVGVACFIIRRWGIRIWFGRGRVRRGEWREEGRGGPGRSRRGRLCLREGLRGFVVVGEK